MLTDEFKQQRARVLRDLAEKAIDPFIKNRLLSLAERYDVNHPPTRAATTPLDLQFASPGMGPSDKQVLPRYLGGSRQNRNAAGA